MADVTGKRQGKLVSWAHSTWAQSNKHCPYCGRLIAPPSDIASDKEHLVGRNFVPPGTLAGDSFNFIFMACRDCNAEKSKAEWHVSGVSLFNSPARQYDPAVDESARRRAARDLHSLKKGVLLQDAGDEHQIEYGRPGMSIKFGFHSPPQLDVDAVASLASFHVQGLFALITSDDYQVPEKSRILPLERFGYFAHYTHQDWGNPQLIELARRTADWPCFVNIDAANGYFKAVFRGIDDVCWFWCLEWNKGVRIVGAIADLDSTPSVFENLPKLEWTLLPGGGGRIRKNTPLPPGDDVLLAGVVA